MKRINSLSDLLLEELGDLFGAETQLIEALPKMAENCQFSALKIILQEHLDVTKKQAHRLQETFNNIGQHMQGVTCNVMKKYVLESEEIATNKDRGADYDSAIINLAQRMKQYEITGYQIACEYASFLGHTKIVEILNQALNEEQAMNFRLNETAQFLINTKAIDRNFETQQLSHAEDVLSKSKNVIFNIPEGKFLRGKLKNKTKGVDIPRFIGEGNPNNQNLEEKNGTS